MDQLYKKIEAKMKLAGTLGSFITLLLGWLISDRAKDLIAPSSGGVAGQTSAATTGAIVPAQASSFTESLLARLQTTETVAVVALLCLLIGLVLYFATVYAYDRLLMPTRFWSEKADLRAHKWLVQRPPSASLWVLYQNMIRIWNRLFMGATYAVMAGMFLLTLAALGAPYMLLLIPLALCLIGYSRYYRPVLGTED